MQNYIIAQRANNVTIFKYDEEVDDIVKLETFTGIDISLAEPEPNIKEGCIKIPLKVLEERFLNE